MRKLRLTREPLTELAAADLAGVAGGVITHGCTVYPTYDDLASCLKVLVIERPAITTLDRPCS